jgi:REP element-mobilizing transposase RayT
MQRKRRKKARAVQRQLAFRDKDGRRHRAGRPRSKDSGIPHTRREEFSLKHPLHVTLKICEGLPSMRKRRAFKAVMRSFAGGKLGVKDKGGFRLTQFAVLGNHIHLMVEADSREHLASAMGGLTTRLARALNKVWQRSGKVFAARYHDVVLNSPSRVKNALNYILHNGRKHGIGGLERWLDPCSSARWFDGWDDAEGDPKRPAALAHAATWLLSKGWKRRGLLTLVPVLPAL